jgi:hypothetical protein
MSHTGRLERGHGGEDQDLALAGGELHGLKAVVDRGEVGRVLAGLDLRPAEADGIALEHDCSCARIRH